MCRNVILQQLALTAKSMENPGLGMGKRFHHACPPPPPPAWPGLSRASVAILVCRVKFEWHSDLIKNRKMLIREDIDG